MIHRVEDLLPEQRIAIESLLGHPVAETELISVSTVPAATDPEWLQRIQQEAGRRGLDRLTMEDIDAEIAAARRERHERARDKQSGS